MLDTAGFVLGHLAALVLLWSSCLATGSLVVRRLVFRDVVEAVAVTTGVGFGLLGILLFLVGLVGALYGAVVASLLIVLHLAAIALVRRRGFPELERTGAPGRSSIVVALAAVAPSFVLALYPPTAFDATLYHLPYARLFAEQHAVVFADALRFPVFPQLNEMLFTAALLLYDDVSAHLVQLLAFAVTALTLAAWSNRVENGRGGLFAGAMWLGSPMAVYLAGSGYIDLGVAMFVTLSFSSLERWKETARIEWLLAGGAFVGMAAGSKYHGALIGALMIIALLFSGRGRRMKSVPLLLFAAALCAAPFYVRNIVATGNPFFPYLYSIFGGTKWLTRSESRILADASGAFEVGAVLLRKTIASPEFWIFPWRTAFDRDALHGMPPITIWMLLIVPAALAGAFRFRSLRAPIIVALAYSAAAATLDPRFMIIVLPLYIHGAAVWLSSVVTTRWIAASIVVMAILPGPAYGVYRIMQQGPLPVTGEERRAYLTVHVPPYAALDYLNTRCGSGYAVYVLRQESAAYHSDGRFLGDHMGTGKFSNVEDDLDDPPGLARELRGMSVDYFVVDGNRAAALESDGRFRQLFRNAWSSPAFEVYQVPGGRDCAVGAVGGIP